MNKTPNRIKRSKNPKTGSEREMKTERRSKRQRGLGRGRSAAFAVIFLLLGTAACDNLLSVEIPGSVQEEDLDNPDMAATLFNSAIGSFECAYTNYVATVGVLTEEYIVSTAWLNSNIWGWRGTETRQADGSCSNNRDASQFGAYTPLHEARFLLEDAIERLESFDAEEVPDHGEMLTMLTAYTGYAYTLLGEGFCEMAIDEGPALQPDEVLRIAEDYFTDAINLAGQNGNEDMERMALVGRARVRLNLGNDAGAAADASQIPQGWSYTADYSTIQGSRENRVYNVTVRNAFLSVAPGYRELHVNGNPDPRVPAVDTGEFGHDGTTEQWEQQKYESASAPIPIASWEEAQLIVAEALGGSDAVQAINDLRAAQGIDPLDNPDESNMLPVVLEERRRQLFSEGHRLNDMLRHDIAFPQGTNHKGQSYGPTTCLWLPDQERDSNPNL